MGIEQILNQKLNEYPVLKRKIKRVYQRLMYEISPKIQSEGNIIRVSPDDTEHEYFFGYYDKSPWDITDRYMLCMKAKDTWSDVSPREQAEIILIDTGKNNKITVLAETNSWNVQQSCMLQWLGPKYKDRVLYNDFRDGHYCSVILKLTFAEDVITVKEEKVFSVPIYSVAADGTFALTLDFSRLYRLRPGYGYYNVPEKTKEEKLPDAPCIWKLNLESGEVIPILKYTDFANFAPRPEMQGAEHKVNHIMLNPDGKRFMVLYRWFAGQRKYTRLITCNVDGTDMYNLSDDDMVSHCYWKNNNQILAFENKKEEGSGYYLMKDKTQEYVRFWSEIDYDGHPSYSPDGSKIVFDRYPDRARVAAIMMSDAKNRNSSDVKTIVRVFAPFKYDNDTRCDLHPRWNRAGDKICFDSVFEGHRGLYTVKVDVEKKKQLNNKEKKNVLENAKCISVIVPVYNVEKYLEQCVSSLVNQTYYSLEIILVDDGSSDKSGVLCDELAKEDKRIKVIHKTNGGLSSARNAGIEVSTGNYITFVDSDDWVSTSIYEKCMDIFETYKCDVVDYKTVFTDRDNASSDNKYTIEPIEVKGEDILYDYLFRGQTEKCPFSVCRKVYKRALYDEISFPEGKVNEDIATNYKVLSKAESLVHISDIGYYYFQNANSITNGKLKSRDFDLLDASRELCKLSKNLSDKRIYDLAKVKLGRSYFSLLAKAAVGGIADDIEQPKICMKELTRNLRKAYPSLMKSPISINRKIIITMVGINYKFIALPMSILKKVQKK